MVEGKNIFSPLQFPISFNPGLGWCRYVLWASSPQPLLASGTDFVEDNFCTDGEGSGLDDSSTLHLLCTLFLLLLQKFHLRSSGIRSRRLGTSVLCHLPELLMGLLFSISSGSLPGNAPSLAAFLSLTQLPAPLRSLLLQNKLTALEYLSKGLLTVKFKSEEVPRIILNWEGYYISFSYPPALPSLLP